MIKLKTKDEIEYIREASVIVSQTLQSLAEQLTEGISTAELNTVAHNLILKAGARPSFLGYASFTGGKNFPASICVSVNDTIIHGIPDNYKITKGDVISIDCGVEYKGYYSDAAFTKVVGKTSEAVEKLLQKTKQSLAAGIEAAGTGKHIRDISKAISDSVGKGYGIVKDFCGHGVGFAVHEDPSIPNHVTATDYTVRIRPGMVLAIEPMLTLGSGEIRILEDQWTVVSNDATLAAHFEHTVAILDNGVDVLTTEIM